MDLKARRGHPRCVREGEVTLSGYGLGGYDLDLSGATLNVIVEGFQAPVRHAHVAPLFVIGRRRSRLPDRCEGLSRCDEPDQAG